MGKARRPPSLISPVTAALVTATCQLKRYGVAAAARCGSSTASGPTRRRDHDSDTARRRQSHPSTWPMGWERWFSVSASLQGFDRLIAGSAGISASEATRFFRSRLDDVRGSIRRVYGRIMPEVDLPPRMDHRRHVRHRWFPYAHRAMSRMRWPTPSGSASCSRERRAGCSRTSTPLRPSATA